MLKLGRVTKVKVLFLVLVYVFNFDLFEFSAAMLEKGLFQFFLAREFSLLDISIFSHGSEAFRANFYIWCCFLCTKKT